MQGFALEVAAPVEKEEEEGGFGCAPGLEGALRERQDMRFLGCVYRPFRPRIGYVVDGVSQTCWSEILQEENCGADEEVMRPGVVEHVCSLRNAQQPCDRVRLKRESMA